MDADEPLDEPRDEPQDALVGWVNDDGSVTIVPTRHTLMLQFKPCQECGKPIACKWPAEEGPDSCAQHT